MDRFIAKITPEASSGLPTFNALVEATPAPPLSIWGGGNEPFPTPPIAFPPGWIGGVPPFQPPEQLPAPTARWEFCGGEEHSGWYFAWGPFARPRQLGFDHVNLDPAKSDWKTMDGRGWTFYSGPYDKPIPIFGVDPPDPEEPPTEPPVAEGCRWRFGPDGWVLICGPYDKPKPPHTK